MRGIAPIFYSGRLVPVRYNLSIVSRSSFTLIELLVVTRLRPSDYGRASRHRGSFTLIELLVVIAIVAILSAVVIITLNPAELLKQSRDSNRLSDLNTLNKALALYEVDVVGGTLGATSTVYVSLPDTSATCANLGLPTLPVGYQYGCVTEANLRKTDGSGWIPVDLTQISSNTPLGSLPTDPVNATSSGLYYTYVPGGSFALSSLLESQKRLSTNALKDGGYDPGRFEIGSDLNLIAESQGLVGWWSFDQGSAAIVPDDSGNDNIGTWSGAGIHATTTAKVGKAAAFNGTDDYVSIANESSFDFERTDRFTIMAWIKPANMTGIYPTVVGKTTNSWTGYIMLLSHSGDSFNTNAFGLVESNTNSTNDFVVYSADNSISATWKFVAVTSGGTSNVSGINLYVGGGASPQDPRRDGLSATILNDNNLEIGRVAVVASPGWFNGVIDEVRIYRRVLPAAEIAAIYNATR